MAKTEARFISGPAGQLDSRWHGAGPPVLVLHPHPLFGGTMGSRLVYDVATQLASHGRQAIRFNYRGVGRSEGSYGDGVGEVEDAAAVAAAAGDPILVGYSFGGGVACRLAARSPPSQLILVAAPPQIRGSQLAPIEDAPRIACPTTLIVGDQDPFVSVQEAHDLVDAFPDARLVVLPGAGHFLEPSHNAAAAAAVVAALP